jgi:hypothetical protein
MRRVMLSVLLTACPGDDAAPARGTTAGSSSGTSTGQPYEPGGADSTGDAEECADAYPGNHDAATATPIALGTDSSDVALGDLVVCSTAPSDFYALLTECAGYLSVEIRRLEREEPYMPDLVLYDDDQPVEELMGVWRRAWLKPLQRHVDPGTHVLEVRHSGGDAQRYSLTAVLLPDSTCR